jgi:hypothetical protein
MGDLIDRWLANHDDAPLIRLHSDQFELWCYRLPDGGLLADHLQRSLKFKGIRQRDPQEDRWFVVNLLEAALAWSGMVEDAVLVVLRNVFGGTVEDSEIEESLKNTASWIAGR